MLDPNGIDFVVPLGRGSQFKNCELRYCLRSLERHAKGIRRVVVVGNNPGFLSKHVLFLDCPELPVCREARIALKVKWAWENADLTDEILFGNDDYFFLRDFDARKVPYFHFRTLIERATEHRRAVPLGDTWSPEPTQRVLQATHDALIAAGLPGVSYELHYPIRYQRAIYCGDLSPFWEAASKHPYGFGPRSVYGNYVCGETPGPTLIDVKLARYFGEQNLANRLSKTPDRICLSYGDQALFEGFEQWLYDRFPEKSRFEV